MAGAESEVRVLLARDVADEPIRWLWPGRLALGKLSLLEGDPGLGKSLVTLDLCARLSRGLPLPDGAVLAGPCNSLVLNAEDSGDTVRARLAALGADLERVYLMEGDALRLPSQGDKLEEALVRTEARLLVIDPLLAFLDAKVSSANDQNVRRALAPLGRLAARRSCAVQMVRHLNKRGGQRAVYRGGGAIGLVGMCRSAWVVGRDPMHGSRCVLAQVKNNLAAAQPSLAYEVQAESAQSPRLRWLGTSRWGADEVVGGLTRGWQRCQARAFLHALLEGGPRPAREVWEEAQRLGLNERTLKRAKKELGIRSEQGLLGGVQQYYWLLAGQELPAGLRAPSPADDLEEWLAPLRAKYPSRTPLDEE
jgi:hypothetical protein